MPKIFWIKLLTTTTGGAVLIALFSVISRLLGLYRDRLLASHFGAGSLLDAYYAAFRLPDLVFNTLVFGALAAAFIPIFTKTWIKNPADGLKLSNSALNWLSALLIALSLIVFLFAEPLMNLVAPGFDRATLSLSVKFTKIIIFSIIFFGFSAVISGVLNSWKKFFTFSLAPVFYNLGIIMGIFALYPAFGPEGLAWGVVFGSFLHFLIQLCEALICGWKYQWQWHLSPELKKIFSLMLPRTIGLAAGQFNQVIITVLASGLAMGSLAIFNLANNLASFPISVFGISLAIAAFPVFSEALSQNNPTKFVSAFSLHFRRVIFLIVPVSIFILLLRAQIVRVILGTNNFDWTATYYTANTLGIFAVSLFAQSLIPMITRSFFALEDTKTPLVIGGISIGLNITLSFALTPAFGVLGLAMAFSTASIINMLILVWALRIKFGYLDDKRIILSTLKISFNSLVAGAVVYLILRLMADLVDMTTFLGIFLQGLVAGVSGAILYLGLSFLSNAEEVLVVKSWLGKFLQPIFTSNGKHGK